MSEALLDRKYEYWQNQLLDLGKRNRMINYRETKRATLKLIEPKFEELFKRVAIDEEELTFQSPIDKNSDIRTYSVLSLLESLSCPIPVNIGDIKAEGSILERQKTLKQLRSKSRLALDEQGTNILYMVSGFVEWREKNDASSTWIKSPLILVPVSLVLESINSPYILKKYEDDIVVNPTLSYLFERDYGIVLPSFDPDEEPIIEYMDKMEKLVDRKGWRIIRENSIGLVSFLKINMYKDLCNNEEEVKNNPIIRAFAGENSEISNIPLELYNFNHDNTPAMDIYQVVNADSSQQDAILLSRKGISFVMQGPPGTGKSQTITNIIAQGLADGKRILFVSEKAAALEVVHKRLSEVHLDDFCLALHNYKANKKDVLDELGKSLSLNPIKVKTEETAKLTELDTLKEFLGKYVSDIHKEIMPLEMSLYEVYGAIADLEDTIELPLEIENVENMTKDQVNRLGLLVVDFDKAKSNLGDQWYKNPWNVGYESGGQLTNAVKNNPFSILLFDEIEKAHPSILDKFLQILEDGRMTDGQGNTVYFSETIIIFTSNLGIYQTIATGERRQVVNSDMSYEEVQSKVRAGIEHYFKLELGRPEILNRIGENIVVFDFIRENVAGEILDSQINRIINNLKMDKNIKLTLSDEVHEILLNAAIGNLDNGGRGIGNIVESMFINPLSRYMFDKELFSDCEITVNSIVNENMTYSLECVNS